MGILETESVKPHDAHDEEVRTGFGDPVFEDKGLTPQFLDLAKKYRKQLER